MNKKLLNFCVLFLVIILFILVVEIFLRVFNIAPYGITPEKRSSFLNVLQKSDIEGLGYELKPNFEGYLEGFWIETNSQGLRGKEEYILEKPEGVYRIEIFGDSMTMGQANELEYIYPELLKKRFLENNIEVINFGITGYNTEQELILLKEKGLQYNPDLIIIQYFLNDMDEKVPYFEKKSVCLGLKFRVKEFTLQHSYFYTFLFRKWVNLANKLGRADNWITHIKQSYNNEELLKKQGEVLDELKQIAEKNNLTVVFVNFPLFEEPFGDDYLFLKENQQIKQMVEEKGFYYIETLNYLKDIDVNQYVISKIDAHPNHIGHQLFADIIYQNLTLSSYFPSKEKIKEKEPLNSSNENFIRVIRLN